MSETPSTEKLFNRKDLVTSVAEKTGQPRAKVTASVDAVFKALEDALQGGYEIRLTGFGVFVVRERKAGKGRDPRTGAEIDIPASRTVRFRPGKQLKSALDGTEVAGTAD